jgi:hypothetical protein
VAGFVRPAPRVLGILAVGVVAAAALGFAADRSSEATGPAAVRLTDLQTTFTQFGENNSPGSGEIMRFTLFGSSSTTKAIGHAVILCTYVGQGERSCSGTYVVPRGTIQTAGILRTRLLYNQAITGGTGLFDNARGTLTVTAKSIKPRREILIFRLTG